MMFPAPAPSRLSVIIPSWNDRDNLGRLIPTLARLNEFHEIIVVERLSRPGDGGYCACGRRNLSPHQSTESRRSDKSRGGPRDRRRTHFSSRRLVELAIKLATDHLRIAQSAVDGGGVGRAQSRSPGGIVHPAACEPGRRRMAHLALGRTLRCAPQVRAVAAPSASLVLPQAIVRA